MKNFYLLILGLLISLPAAVAFGQKGEVDEGPVGIFQSGAEYDQFMRGAKQAAYGPNGSPELKAMIPMLNDIALNRPVGWTAQRYGEEASAFGLLSDSKVRAELDMLDNQYEEFQRLNSEIQKRAAEQLRGLDFKNSNKLVEQIRRIRDQANSDLDAVLLPHQLERLQQIHVRSQLRRRSLVDILTSDPVKSDLEITDRQSEELRQEEKEIEEDLARQIAKLREQARDRLLSKLSRSQKAEVEEMLGDTFEFGQKTGIQSGKRKRK